MSRTRRFLFAIEKYYFLIFVETDRQKNLKTNMKNHAEAKNLNMTNAFNFFRDKKHIKTAQNV